MKPNIAAHRFLMVLGVAAILLVIAPRLLAPAYAVAKPQDDVEDMEEEVEDRDELMKELQLARAEAEVDSLRLQIAERRLALVRELAAVSEDQIAAAAYGLMRVSDYMEDDAAAEFLTGIADDTSSTAIKRLIRIRLAELEREDDDRESRQENLKKLILDN